MANTNREANCNGNGWTEIPGADPAYAGTPDSGVHTRNGSGHGTQAQRTAQKGSAGRAGTDAGYAGTGAMRPRTASGQANADSGIDARSPVRRAAHASASSSDGRSGAGTVRNSRTGRNAAADSGRPQKGRSSGHSADSKKKKKRKGYSFKDVLKMFIPWRGDSGAEAARKIVFSSALAVVGVCTYLIGSYYLDLYESKREYAAMQAEVEAARSRRGFSENGGDDDLGVGGEIEYLDYNYVAEKFLPQNPDLVGYIKIPDTLISYPVAQKKNPDPNKNENEYYLYRTFHQEQSRAGCIFMDFRCNFDVVAEHRRVVKNSDNILIYGHNMNNMSMFGSLRNYVNNPNWYKAHPVVELDSCYNNYDYKIFAVFIVDGTDYESKYAFNVWNTIDFEDEEDFYNFVNNAKRRNMISNDVDVEYGDPLLTLYTCNGLVKNAKLIITARRMRPGEDRLEGTQDATLNDNVMYPKAYYDLGHPENFDESRFVPYGPKEKSEDSKKKTTTKADQSAEAKTGTN